MGSNIIGSYKTLNIIEIEQNGSHVHTITIVIGVIPYIHVFFCVIFILYCVKMIILSYCLYLEDKKGRK